MSNFGWRPHIESLRCLDLTRMMKVQSIRPNSSHTGSWVWTNSETGERVASIGYSSSLESETGEVRLNYSVTPQGEECKHMDYVVQLRSMPLHFGGRRWYFICPSSGRRAKKLYLVQGKFVARLAIRPKPTYAIQRVSGLDRAMAQRSAIRRKLGDSGKLIDPLTKPKWMRWKTWDRYDQRDSELDGIEYSHIIRRWGRLLD